MIEVEQNFDWSITNKKLAIYMSNFNGKALTETSILGIINAINKSGYKDNVVIIVGNDNIKDDFSHLVKDNVFSFTLIRDDKNPRNQGFIRNYFIKRTQSEHILLKDGEVALEGKFINNCINWKNVWLPGNVHVLNPEETSLYIKAHNIKTIETSQAKRFNLASESYLKISNIKEQIVFADGKPNISTYCNYALACPSRLLKSINGYDEEYRYYGWEDTDLFCRLTALGKYYTPDYQSTSIHLYHSPTVNNQQLPNMRNLFIQKDPRNTIRNFNGWGEGF